jgi:hypothetical protein
MRTSCLSALRRGPAPCHVGHASQVTDGIVGRASRLHCAVLVGCLVTFGPFASFELKYLFIFCFGLKSNLNFENPYLSVQSSKTHETSSVSFLNLRPTH